VNEYDQYGNEIIDAEIVNEREDEDYQVIDLTTDFQDELDPFEIEIGAHLQNHTPPIPLIMVEACVTAISKANVGLWDDEIELPKGTLWKESDVAPVWVIITSHHLEKWVTPQENLITITDPDGNVVYKGLGTGELITEEGEEGELNG